MGDQASDLFQQYVHARVRLAHMQFKAKKAKTGLANLKDGSVDSKKAAEKVLADQKKADGKFQAKRKAVAQLTTVVAKDASASAQMQHAAAQEEHRMFQSKKRGAKNEENKAEKSLEKSKARANKAEKASEAASNMVKQTESMGLKALLSETKILDGPK